MDYEQCGQKWRNLEKRYREHCNALLSGTDAMAPWYFDEMDSLLRGPPGTVPSWDELAAAGSHQKHSSNHSNNLNTSNSSHSSYVNSTTLNDVVTIDLESPDSQSAVCISESFNLK